MPNSARLSVAEKANSLSGLTFNEVNLAEASVITETPPPAYDFSACGGCDLAITADTVNDNDAITPPGDGETVLVFDISNRVSLEPAWDDVFEGGLTLAYPPGTGTKGTVTYRAIINESYLDDQPNDYSVDAGDTLSNPVRVSAQVINAVPTGNYPSDSSSASITIVGLTFSKDLIGHTPLGGTLDVQPFIAPTPLRIAPNDVVTYKLTVDIPSGDMETLVIKDFLPIPFFDVAEMTTFVSGTNYTPADGDPSSIPLPGDFGYGSGTTGLPPLTPSCLSLDPALFVDVPTNTFELRYLDQDCFEKTPSTPIHLEIYFSITAQPKPMADSLKLVNFATFSADNSSVANVYVTSAIIDQITSQPQLNLTKGVVSSDKATAVFDPAVTGPVGFALPGTDPLFAGPFSSDDLVTNPIDSDISDVDAGDKLRFVATIENIGNANAYDIEFTETLPAGFAAPTSVADLNLRVYDAGGTDRTADFDGGLFGFVANGGTSDGTDTVLKMKTGPAFLLPPYNDLAQTRPGQANEGENILLVTYELGLAQSVSALSEYENEAQLTKFTSQSGSAFNYLDPLDPKTDNAVATINTLAYSKIPTPSLTADMAYTTCADSNNCRVTVGEAMRYRIPVTVPEGTTSFSLSDNIPSGMGYYFTPGVTLDGTTANCPEATANFVGALPSVAVVSPVGAGVAPSGGDLTVNFTNAIATNNNNTTDNTFCVFYETVHYATPTAANKTNRVRLTVGATQLPEKTAIARFRQPILNVAKAVSPNSGDAGDIVQYTITIAHDPASNSDATDISLSDILPADVEINLLDAVQNFATDGLDNDGDGLVDGLDPDEVAASFYNSGTKTFTFNSTTTTNTKFNQLIVGATIVLTFKAVLKNTVTPSQIITNTASLTYDSILGVSVTGIDKNGTNNSSINVNVISVSAGKGVNATSLAQTGSAKHNALNTDLAIGEQITYRISVNVPEAAVSNFVIIDNVPLGMRIDSASLVSDATSSPAPTIGITDENADTINDRATITFPTIIAPAVPSGSPVNRLIEIDVVATLLDHVSNTNGAVKANNISVNWTGITGGPITAVANIDVVEPDLLIDKSVATPNADAGDIVEFTLNMSHGLLSSQPAFDVAITDTLPSEYTILDFGLDGIDNDLDGNTDDAAESALFAAAVAGQVITLNNTTSGLALFDELAEGISYSFKYRALIDNAVFPEQVLTNTAVLDYSSAPSPNPDRRDYNKSDIAQVTIHDITPVKTVHSTSLADTGTGAFNPANQDLAIGETVTYRISMAIPETNMTNYQIMDTLPSVFEVISASLINDSGVSHSFVAPVFQDNLNGDGINDTVVFAFGNVSNTPNPGIETIEVEVVAKVKDNLLNVAGTPYTNTATISFDEKPVPYTVNSSADLVEPSISTTKTVLPLAGDSGDAFEFTITITNNGQAPAYDVEITDIPGSKIIVDTGFSTDGLDNTGDTLIDNPVEALGNFYNGTQFAWNNTTTANPLFAKLDPGGSITLKYRVTLANTVLPNEILANTANVSYDSYPGAEPDQRLYSDSDTANITVSSNAFITKSLRDAVIQKKINDTIPYRIEVRIPEGTIDGLVIDDTLDPGLAFLPGTLNIINSNPAEVAYDGTPLSPVLTPDSVTLTPGVSQNISFAFGNMVNSNTNNAVDEILTVEYDVLVLNTADNNLGDLKNNSAAAVYGTTGGTQGPVVAPVVTVIEPIIGIQLSSVYAGGDVITYQIRIENNGDSSAYDNIIESILPPGLTYNGNLLLLNGPALPAVDISGSPNLIFTYAEISSIYNAGNPIIFTFDAIIDNSVAPGTLIVNNGSITATGQNGPVSLFIPGNIYSGERTGNPLDDGGAVNDYNSLDSVSDTVLRPDLSTSFKTVTDINGAPVQANDILLYRVEVINTGNTPASGITVVDEIPANLNSFTIVTYPVTGIDNSVYTPLGLNGEGKLDFSAISLGAAGSLNDTEIIEYTVKVDTGLPDGTNIVNGLVISPPTEGGPGKNDSTSTSSSFPTMSILKTVSGSTLKSVGNVVDYKVTVSNTGSSPSTNATITDAIPSQLSYLAGSIRIDAVTKTDVMDLDEADFGGTTPGTLSIVIPAIAPAQTVDIEYQAIVKSNASGMTVINTAILTDDQGTNLNSSSNISVKLVPVAGGTSGGHLNSVFEDGKTNQRNESTCEVKVTEPYMVQSSCLQLNASREIKFEDLANDSYAPFINTLKNTQIIRTGDYIFSGTDNHSTGKQQAKFQTGTWNFEPEREVTRLEAVKTALIANCIPVDDTIYIPENGFRFLDMPPQSTDDEVEDFARRVFYTAYRYNIVKGDNNRAKAYEKVTAAENLAIFLRAASALPPVLDNIETSPWYKKYEDFAKLNGILTNTNVYSMEEPVLRKDLAKIITRIMAYNPNPEIYGYIERVDIINQQFHPNLAVMSPDPLISEEEDFICLEETPKSCLSHDPDRPLKFNDNPEDQWFYPFVEILRTTKINELGDYIASGNGNHSTGRQETEFRTGVWHFEPDRYSTRLELIKVALVSNCITIEDNVPIPSNGFRFTDLPVTDDSSTSDNFASRVFYTAYKHGIIQGVKRAKARPYDDISRVEALTILTRASIKTPIVSESIQLPFIDTSDKDWYAPLLALALENELVGIDGEHMLFKDRKVKRSEMSKLIFYYMTLNDNPAIREYATGLREYYKI